MAFISKLPAVPPLSDCSSDSFLDTDVDSVLRSQDDLGQQGNVDGLQAGSQVELAQNSGDENFLLHHGELLPDAVAGPGGERHVGVRVASGGLGTKPDTGMAVKLVLCPE